MTQKNYLNHVASVAKLCFFFWKCQNFIVHNNGFIKGWMTIFDIVDRDAFKCTTTGRNWAGGIYVQRTGKFHPLNPEVLMKGFMGYHYIEEN